MEFRTHLETCANLPTQNSNRGYKVSTILESFLTSIWFGANRFYILRSLDRIMLWEIFLIRNKPRIKTLIKDILRSLPRPSTKMYLSTFSLVFFKISI